MAIKIENNSTIKLPKNSEPELEKIVKYLPVEHTRGIEKVRLVDFIDDPRIRQMNIKLQGDLPGLYHPKQLGKPAWLEVSVGALLKPTETWANRIMPKMTFKPNLAGIIFSLVGQHYYLTLRHSVKKTQIEGQVRQYAERNLKTWSESQNQDSFRAKLFKPLRPLFERMAKWLNKKALEANKAK